MMESKASSVSLPRPDVLHMSSSSSLRGNHRFWDTGNQPMVLTIEPGNDLGPRF